MVTEVFCPLDEAAPSHVFGPADAPSCRGMEIQGPPLICLRCICFPLNTDAAPDQVFNSYLSNSAMLPGFTGSSLIGAAVLPRNLTEVPILGFTKDLPPEREGQQSTSTSILPVQDSHIGYFRIKSRPVVLNL